MKKTKQVIRKNRRVFILIIALVIIVLILLNFQDVLEGLKDGARDAGLSY